MSEQVVIPPINKSSWGEGPWQHEPDRVDFEHAGFACFVRRHQEYGHLCGYVGIPSDHPLYGKPYEECDVDGGHRGVNYSGACDEKAGICHVPAPGMPADVWWLGFDCGHAGDLSPGLEALSIQMGVEPLSSLRALGMRVVYRDLPYVRRATELLAEKLADVGGAA